MKVKNFCFNPYQENTFIVYNEENKEGIVVDCGAYDLQEEQAFASFVAQEELRLVAHLITHTHPDHICGASFVEKKYGLKPLIHLLDGTQEYLGTRMEVISTPGHKEDSVCFYFPEQKLLFSGDTLFRGSIGRTDLPGGDFSTLIHSIKTRLFTLPEDIVVLPGHGIDTTIGYEKQYNPFFNKGFY